ncbi:MAG: hypothetical protein DRR08_10025 [Candidatus Parabeggiatoa sp. nov. 2]|nr:MAG: hypothetical protein DRR08_10025 [Gammaproteobacteria bacterium]
MATENLAPKRRLQADDKVEPWRLKTWPQKGDSTTKLSRGGRKPSPKKARRFDDKPEPWWLKTECWRAEIPYHPASSGGSWLKA